MMHPQPIFITGIGTDIGKTVVAAIVTEALQAAYWKPIQAGYDQGTDSEWVGRMIGRPEANGPAPDGRSRILPETYKLSLAASPHIAARQEGISISLDRVAGQLAEWQASQQHIPGANPGADPRRFLVIEGAGGLLVPLNDKEFVLDLARALDAPLILVSRNYLGSINHSLLTASVCKTHGLKVAGWIFNDRYGNYEEEIVQWSGFPSIASIPYRQDPDPAFIRAEAERIREPLLAAFGRNPGF
jgi:dethiobiotin synthetase